MRACLWPQSGLRAAFAGREAPATCRSWHRSHCHPRAARALPRPQCLPARRSWRRPWFCSPCASGAWTPGLHLSAGRPASAGACAWLDGSGGAGLASGCAMGGFSINFLLKGGVAREYLLNIAQLSGFGQYSNLHTCIFTLLRI